MRFFKWFLTVQCIVATAFGTNWYVDNAATGANNGTSWANAWVNPTNVVWETVNPGDTVYVSGGATQKIYNDWLIIGRDGLPGKYVTVKVGQEPGHNGKAIFEACGVSMNTTAQWAAIDGSRSVAFVSPTNHQQVIKGPSAITNNIGFWFRNLVGTNKDDASPALWYFRSPNNLRFSYIEVSGLTNSGNFEFHEDRGTVCYASVDQITTTNIVFEYLFLHDNSGQQFSWNGQKADSFDNMIFRLGWIHMGGEDHFEVGSGWTISDSVIGPCSGTSVHNDFFQFTGNYIKVFNNDIRESANAIMRVQTYPDEATQGLRHNIFFFNNLVTEKPGRAPGGGTLVEPICMVHFDSEHPCNYTTYSNIVFANNLFYKTVPNTIVSPPEMVRNAVIYWSKGNMVANSVLKQVKFVNNLILDKQHGVSFPASTRIDPVNGFVPYTTNDVVLDFNCQAAIDTSLENATQVYYMDTATNMGNGPFAFHNNGLYPAFTDPVNDNFELQSGDVAALNNGADLSYLFNFDALNRTRGVGGAWDRGPLERQPTSGAQPPPTGTSTNLAVWITFDDAFDDSRLDDASGNNAHAYRYGRIGSTYPTNFPSQLLTSSTPGRTNLASTDKCGRFDWYTTGYGIYGREGDYAAITNVTRVGDMAKASIMCWARYYPPHAGLDFSSDGNAKLLSAGTSAGIPGSWDFGRFNMKIWLNNTRFYVLTNQATFEKSTLEFPDNGFEGDGDTFRWHHYAVTWDNGIMTGYYDGIPFQTNNISGLVTRLKIGTNNNNPTPWIGIGCDTHSGTPALADESPDVEYPNNGFMNGVIDDVRIYDATLNPAEIQAIVNGAPLPPRTRLAAPMNLVVRQ